MKVICQDVGILNIKEKEMTLPIGEIGASAASGGAAVAFVMKILPILMRKINGKKTENKKNAKPGTAKTCIDRGLKIKEHDMAILGLCGSVERIEKQQETARIENREDHGKMFEKLDNLKK